MELWKGIQFGGNDLVVTHSVFADDTLLFGSTNINEAKHIKYLLDQYSLFLGQEISKVKSKIFFFNTTPPIAQRIKKILDFEEEKLPSTYLGVPFFMGKNKASYWKNIVDRIKARTMAWKVRWLSLSGKILLIKSILSAIPNYYFSILSTPKFIIKQIEGII